MKGLLFYDKDCGRGGHGGFLAHYQAWCVEIDGKKVHIHSELTGDLGFAPEDGGPTRHVRVEPCNNCCRVVAEVDEWTTALVIEQMSTTDRPLTPDEVEQLSRELAGTTCVSELLELFRSVKKARERDSKMIRAGRDLYYAVKDSALRWFFRNQIAEYEQSTHY